MGLKKNHHVTLEVVGDVAGEVNILIQVIFGDSYDALAWWFFLLPETILSCFGFSKD